MKSPFDSPLSGFRSPFGRRLGFSVAASFATWDSDTDTYTQDLFVEDASFATWDSDTDTYTRTTYGA